MEFIDELRQAYIQGLKMRQDEQAQAKEKAEKKAAIVGPKQLAKLKKKMLKAARNGDSGIDYQLRFRNWRVTDAAADYLLKAIDDKNLSIRREEWLNAWDGYTVNLQIRWHNLSLPLLSDSK